MGRFIAIVALVLVVLALIGKQAERDERAAQNNLPTDQRTATDHAVNPNEPGRWWVTASRLERRTYPSAVCGIVGQLFFREAATVIERRGPWARITQPYDAGCEGGRSAYVDRGRAACTPDNGIIEGRFAEWVVAANLSETRPPDPAASASQAERLVAQSDDFRQYRAAFVHAANSLIESGRCTPGDFEEQGGWMKSSNHRDEPVYFTYCGGMTIANRIYLNAGTGRIF